MLIDCSHKVFIIAERSAEKKCGKPGEQGRRIWADLEKRKDMSGEEPARPGEDKGVSDVVGRGRPRWEGSGASLLCHPHVLRDRFLFHRYIWEPVSAKYRCLPVSVNKTLWEPSHTSLFTISLWLLLRYSGRGGWAGTIWPQSLKSLLYGSVQKVCQPLPCSTMHSTSYTGGMRWVFFKIV